MWRCIHRFPATDEKKFHLVIFQNRIVYIAPPRCSYFFTAMNTANRNWFVMPYIELNDITEQHLHGRWEVESRFINAPDIVSPFATHYRMDFSARGSCTFRNGNETEVRWELGREEEVIYNPRVKFFLGDQEIGSAIITRLMVSEEPQYINTRLTLYFSSGTELVLKKSEKRY